MEKVFTTSIIDPLCFWARVGYDEDLDAEEILETLINEFVNSEDHKEEKLTALSCNQVVIAKSNEQRGHWLKAMVVSDFSSESGTEVDVIFTGFGSNELIKRKDVITTIPDYVVAWTKSAECFALDGIEPIDETWSDEAIRCFNNFILKKRLLCRRVTSSRLVVYTSKEAKETIQDHLVKKKLAKRSKAANSTTLKKTLVVQSLDEQHASNNETSGIPQFDILSLYSKTAESQYPPEEELTGRDFEQEEQLKRLGVGWAANSVGYNEFSFQTHTDCLDYVQQPIADADFKTTLAGIKREIALSERASGNLHPIRGRNAAFVQFPGDKEYRNKSKLLHFTKDIDKIPHASSCLAESSCNKHTAPETKSFGSMLQKQLRLNRPLREVFSFMQQALADDDTSHHILSECLAIIVDHILMSATINMPSLEVLWLLETEPGFIQCLINAVQQNHYLFVTTVKSKNLSDRFQIFADLVAYIVLMFPDNSDIINCVFGIVDKWALFGINNSTNDKEQHMKSYAVRLNRFIRIIVDNSDYLLRNSFSSILKTMKEKLFSNNSPRSVKEILLELLLYIERKETEKQLARNAPGQTGGAFEDRALIEGISSKSFQTSDQLSSLPFPVAIQSSQQQEFLCLKRKETEKKRLQDDKARK